MSRDFFSRLSLVNQLQPSLPGNAGNQVQKELFRVFVCQGDCAITVDLARRRREPGGRRQPARRDIIRVVNAISAEQRPTRLPALKHFRAFLINTHRSEEHTSELQSLRHLVCRLLLEKIPHSPGAPPPPSSIFCSAPRSARAPARRAAGRASVTPGRRAHEANNSPRLPALFLNDPGTTEISTLSLHDALPI